jgi:hypothetical protein
MTITKTAKEYAAPRLESAVEYATPKLEAAVDYAAPKLEAARDVAVARAADAMERLAPAAEALRDRLAEKAAATSGEAKKRGRFAAKALRGETPTKKRRTLLWSLIGVVGGLGAGLLVSRKRAAQDATTLTPAWTNLPAPTPTTTPVDETAPATTAGTTAAPHVRVQ